MRIEKKLLDRCTCDLLKALEDALAEIPELRSLSVFAERSSNVNDDIFKSERELEDFRRTPASYRNSDNTIYINERILEAYEDDEQKAILVHEIAHALQNANGDRRATFQKEVDADYHACKWGFEEALKKERRKSQGPIYGPVYAEILQKWQNEADFFSRMRRFGMQKSSRVAPDGLADDA